MSTCVQRWDPPTRGRLASCMRPVTAFRNAAGADGPARRFRDKSPVIPAAEMVEHLLERTEVSRRYAQRPGGNSRHPHNRLSLSVSITVSRSRWLETLALPNPRDVSTYGHPWDNTVSDLLDPSPEAGVGQRTAIEVGRRRPSSARCGPGLRSSASSFLWGSGHLGGFIVA
jgi:hypothetical protein